MAVRETIQIGHPALKAKNKKITDFKSKQLSQLVADLKDTMIDVGLVGMAAPQIAENYQVFVTQPRKTEGRADSASDNFKVYINPKITYFSNKQNIIYEGCGSVLRGQLFGPVQRPQTITIEAYDLDTKKFRLKCDGLLARVIQHEYDHMFGIEFTEKVYDYRQLMTFDHYLDQIRNSPEQAQASKITINEFEYL